MPRASGRHQQVLHLPERARYHGHLHHHGRDRAHRLLHELVHAVLAVARVGRLDAEADLVQAAFGKLLQAALVKQVAARVQARVGVRVKLAGMPEKGVHLLGVQQRLAARDGQAAEPRAHGIGLLELRHDVALMGEEVLVVVLVRVGAEVAHFLTHRKSTKNVAVSSPVRQARHAGDIQLRHNDEAPFSQRHPHDAAVRTRASRGEVSSRSNARPYSSTAASKSRSASSNACL